MCVYGCVWCEWCMSGGVCGVSGVLRASGVCGV